jgi:hypothetical protein
MKIAKSRSYEIDGSNISFEFDREDGKIIGVKKQNDNGDFISVDPKTSEFGDLSQSEEAVNAYNVAKYSSNKRAYVDSIASKSSAELESYYQDQNKKETNEQFIEEDQPAINQPLAFQSPRDGFVGYVRPAKRSSDIMAYPSDIDTNQDHMKITRYEYRRPTVNQSKPAMQIKTIFGERTIAGDTVKGSQIKGSIILPMPKPTDVNAAAWGKSELNQQGLAAIGSAQKAAGLAGLLGLNLTGKTAEDTGKDFIAGLREGGGRRPFAGFTSLRGFGQANATNFITKLANGAFGTELDPDTFLARTGGRVLNPNAEVLFQGPAIRDFAFEFQMIARSEVEGKTIRKIIKFLKLGMAPKFRNTTFIANPDVFQLEYKNGKGEGDMLKTVNQFSPGGLALTNINVDYAPSGYWSAYQDSQPVSVKMSLNFTELRPIFQQDQINTPEDSVGL